MYHSRKKGFTMVELVIVIAVIAILAAILIPTFTNLIRKANEASALANARNAANQLLANLLARGDDAKDLVIFNQKGDDIYVYGYSAEAGRVLAYYGNPVDAKSIDGETLEDKAGKLLKKMLANGELTLRTPRPTETDWWHPSKMEEVVTGLNFKPEEMVLRADYKIVLARFEKGGQPEHTCTAADLDEIAEVPATCSTNGYPAYWVCRVCGRAYHNADATRPVSADDPLVATDINPNAHQLGAWQYDESKHWQVCALNPEHPHLNEAAHTGNPCTVCGYSTGGNTPTSPAGKKNGLVDGYYYKDDELFTGTEDGYEFRNGMLVVDDKLIEGTNVTTNTYTGERTTDQTFSLDGIDEKYITDRLIINLTDISVAKYIINIDSYKVLSATAKVPFADLLQKNGWTEEDCKKLVNENARALFEAGNSYKLQSGKYFCYPSDPLNELKMYLPHINLTSDFVAYLNTLGYEFTANTSSDSYGANSAIADYINRSTGNGATLPFTFAQYLELKYVKGVEINKSGNSYTTGAPASLVFDENHTPEDVGGAYAVNVGSWSVALMLDENGKPLLNQNGTGTSPFDCFGGKFTVSETNDVIGFEKTFGTVTTTHDGNTFTFTVSGNALTIVTTKNENGTTTFVISSGSESATAIWTPGSAGNTVSVGSDGKLNLSAYNLTGDIYGQLNASQRANFITSIFNTGSGYLNSDYVHCDPAVVEAYIKLMNSLSSISAEGTKYSYGANGTVDITSKIKIGAQGTVTVDFPQSQGSDLLYPDVEIILEKS